MTHTYTLTGMTCAGCEAKVKSKLLAVPGITSVSLSKESNTATISMDQHIHLETLQEAIGGANSQYQVSTTQHNEAKEQTKSWFATYKPILLIFTYITIISFIVAWQNNTLDAMEFMTIFMSGFFLTFSFFKLLDLKGFAESYAMYDIIALRFKSWGYLYAFIEVSLGLAYALHANPVITNWVTFVVMTAGIIGVLKSVLDKQKIQCACLGAVFNLPMSTVTIVEDALMIAMSGGMLLMTQPV